MMLNQGVFLLTIGERKHTRLHKVVNSERKHTQLQR